MTNKDYEENSIRVDGVDKFELGHIDTGSLRDLLNYSLVDANRFIDGRPHGKARVHKILQNPYYIGIIRFGGDEYPGAHEPLISKELFERVQKKIHGNNPSRYRHHNPVFKGIILCMNCGGLITWQRQKGRLE